MKPYRRRPGGRFTRPLSLLPTSSRAGRLTQLLEWNQWLLLLLLVRLLLRGLIKDRETHPKFRGHLGANRAAPLSMHCPPSGLRSHLCVTILKDLPLFRTLYAEVRRHAICASRGARKQGLDAGAAKPVAPVDARAPIRTQTKLPSRPLPVFIATETKRNQNQTRCLAKSILPSGVGHRRSSVSRRGAAEAEGWRRMSLDELESDEQTAEILLCFYETYEPVFCTDEKVERIMRSFKKKAAKSTSGEQWRTIMYAEFEKAKGIHPRRFYEQQAEKEGRLPAWMDLESSEKAEARARSEARLVRQNQDAELEALEQHRVQLEIEGRKEYYEAKKRASSARTELEPVREASSTPGGSRLAPASGPDRIESAARARMQRHNLSTAGAECRRRHLSAEGDLATLQDRLVRHEIGGELAAREYARRSKGQLEESTERLSKPRSRPAPQAPQAQPDASRSRARTPGRSAAEATEWSDEQHRKATERLRRAKQSSSPQAFETSLRGGSALRALSSPPRTGPDDGWKPTSKKAPLDSSYGVGPASPSTRQRRSKTPRRTADELFRTLGDVSTQRTRRRKSQSSTGKPPKEEPPQIKRNSRYYENRVQRSRSAPRPQRSEATAGEKNLGPAVPLGLTETLSKLILHTAWWVASHGEKFEALIAKKNEGNANWTFLTQPQTKEAAFYRKRLNFERALRLEKESRAESESQPRENAVVDRLRAPIRSHKGDSPRMGPGRAGTGWENSLRGHTDARARTPSSSGSRTPRRERRATRSPGPRQRSRTPGSARSASSSGRGTRYPQSPGRERGRTPGGQRPQVERLALDTGSARSSASSRGASTPRGWQSPGRQPRRQQGSSSRRQRAASVGKNTRSPGRSREPTHAWRCEWCGEAAPKRYNGPSGPASLCRTCGAAFQASWKKAKDVNQKRAKTPQRVHDAEGAAGDASEVQPHKHVSQESELARLRNEQALPALSPTAKAGNGKEVNHPAATNAGPLMHPQLTMPDKKARRELFDQMDVNGNGGLSLAEIDKAVVEGLVGPVLGCPDFNHKPALIRAYKAADKSGDGFIERSEFAKLLRYIVYFNNLWHKFEEIDSDHDRRLSADEFAAGCITMGLNLSASEAAAEFATCDTDGGGMILFGEFCTWCAEQEHKKDQRDSQPEPEPEPEGEPMPPVVRNLCIRQDLNYPTIGEVNQALKKAEGDVRDAVELLRKTGRERKLRAGPNFAVPEQSRPASEPLPNAEIVSAKSTKQPQQPKQPDTVPREQAQPTSTAPAPLKPASKSAANSAGGGPAAGSGLFKTWDEKAAEFEQLAAQTEGIVHGEQEHATKYSVSTSSGGSGTVIVKASDRSNPDLLTVTCPAGFVGGRDQVLFVKTPSGEELEIPVPDGVESDDEFFVDMQDVDDEDEIVSPKRSANAPKQYRVSTSSGGPAKVKVSVSDASNPDAITVTCPAGFQAGHVLYVKTPDGEELEIPIPDGIETDDDFDVDMGDISDDEEEEDDGGGRLTTAGI
jgi:hypothetical protein